MNNIKVLIVTIFTLALSSCASIIHGPRQLVNITSQPTSATVSIDGVERGNTPQAISLRRKGREKGQRFGKKMYDLKIELNGYHPYEAKIMRKMDGWFIGNIVIGGILGIIIDAANGSMYRLTPAQVIAQLSSSASTIHTTDDDIYIMATLDIDSNWEKIAQLTPHLNK